MATTTSTSGTTKAGIAAGPLAAIAILGLAIVFVTGHLQAGTLHDAAHDVRHATGFPCH